jgi:hypothetical protein
VHFEVLPQAECLVATALTIRRTTTVLFSIFFFRSAVCRPDPTSTKTCSTFPFWTRHAGPLKLHPWAIYWEPFCIHSWINRNATVNFSRVRLTYFIVSRPVVLCLYRTRCVMWVYAHYIDSLGLTSDYGNKDQCCR